MKQIDIEMPFKILDDKDDEIIITTTNRSALDKVVSLSIKYPEEVFSHKNCRREHLRKLYHHV